MFRDYEIRYVAASVLVAWTLSALLGAYEIFINTTDTAIETAVAMFLDAAAATGVTVLVVATVEVIMVLYRRVNERLLANAREEGEEKATKRWREWYDSLPKEIRDQLSPPPENGR